MFSQIGDINLTIVYHNIWDNEHILYVWYTTTINSCTAIQNSIICS